MDAEPIAMKVFCQAPLLFLIFV